MLLVALLYFSNAAEKEINLCETSKLIFKSIIQTSKDISKDVTKSLLKAADPAIQRLKEFRYYICDQCTYIINDVMTDYENHNQWIKDTRRKWRKDQMVNKLDILNVNKLYKNLKTITPVNKANIETNGFNIYYPKCPFILLNSMFDPKYSSFDLIIHESTFSFRQFANREIFGLPRLTQSNFIYLLKRYL